MDKPFIIGIMEQIARANRGQRIVLHPKMYVQFIKALKEVGWWLKMPADSDSVPEFWWLSCKIVRGSNGKEAHIRGGDD